ncbi:MAG: von Willebrand factor type A domain-containing protein [Clostridia bacterium]|nr:von Willebrand factor type A domain-containing protein [Clostridia bacterium]
MKEKKLFESLSLVDDDLLAEALPQKAKAPFSKRLLPILAASFVLLLTVPLTLLFSFGFFEGGNAVTTHSDGYYHPYLTGTFPANTQSPSKVEGSKPSGDLSFDVDDEFSSLLPTEPGMNSPSSPGGDSFTEIIENGFVSTAENTKSFFSIDVSTASFPNIRSTIKNGAKPYKDAVRVEEMLNYFRYDYESAKDGSILALNASLFDTPFNRETKLLTVGLKAEEIEFSDVKNNLVFLIDVSGSMYDQNKLPLVQQAFIMLAENLNDHDRVSIVTYAGDDRVALAGAYGYEKEKITAVIEDLQAGGSTAGSEGIKTAYRLAQEYFIEDGNNRVILMTDGDFNVGVTDNKSLETFITEKRQTGVYFSVYGFGMGNWQADKMETLALNGNGAYGYIDSLKEARRALVEEIGGSIVTVAKDVKAGLSFNPEYVESYRLIGYETKQMSEDEFNNSETDAGELGSGHTVTVVYELKMTDKALLDEGGDLGTVADVTLKYKTPDTSKDCETTLSISTAAYRKTLTAQDSFIAAVVEFALILRDSEYKGDANLSDLIARLNALTLDDEYKEEFREIVGIYAGLGQ